jgi:hypothetical protein
MDDFGNIAYVVAALGWFLWNAYRKTKGNEEQAPKPATSNRKVDQPERQRESTRSLEDLIMEQLGQKPEPKPKPVLQPAKKDNSSKFLSSDLTHSHLSKDYVMSNTEMKSLRVERQVRKGERIELEDDESLMENLFPSGLDMRQAFVLNAVLERPYK